MIVSRNSERAIGYIKRTLRELDFEIDRHKRGKGIVGNPEQLERFKNNLEEMLGELEHNNIMNTHFGMSRVVVVSWQFDSNLGELIITSEQEYMKVKN